MRLPDIMELEKFGFYAGFCTSASICTKLTLTFLSLGKTIEFELFAPLWGHFWRVLGNFLPLQSNDLTTLAQNPG